MALSGTKDHYKEAQKGVGVKLEVQPVFSNYFSQMGHHPSQSYVVKPATVVPPHLNPLDHSSTVLRSGSRGRNATLRSIPAAVHGPRAPLYTAQPLMNPSRLEPLGASLKLEQVRPVAEPVTARAAASKGFPTKNE